MKNTQLNKRKNCFVMFALMFAMTITMVLPASITPAYANEGEVQTKASQETVAPSTAPDTSLEDFSDNSNSGGSGDYSLDKLEENAVDTISDVQETVVNVSLALFPVSLILGLVILYFTHDERKIGLTVKICLTICIVTGLIILINAGVALDIIKSFIEGLQN